MQVENFKNCNSHMALQERKKTKVLKDTWTCPFQTRISIVIYLKDMIIMQNDNKYPKIVARF
jgi:hypothetical protein